MVYVALEAELKSDPQKNLSEENCYVNQKSVNVHFASLILTG